LILLLTCLSLNILISCHFLVTA